MEETPLIPLPSPQERVKLRKHLMGLTLQKAAAEIGVSTKSLSRWEKGLNLTPDNHRKYQQALHRWQETVNNYPQ